jgi:hypothetical protein
MIFRRAYSTCQFYEQACECVFNENTIFQMVGPTCNSPNGFGASGSGDPPPPPPLTPTEALLTAQTDVLRQLLQMRQQMDQRIRHLKERPSHGANLEGPHTVSTYTQFIGMKPPTFTKAEEPLEADAWVRAIEAKFSTFTLPCSEERKANFATLQLQGEALMWWEHYKSMQPAGHEVTWVEFKQAFKDNISLKDLWTEK